MSTGSVRNWAGNVVFGTTDVRRPSTLDELQDMVAESERIRTLGSGHSFSRVADTSGTLVSLDRLAPPVEFDAATDEVIVAAGLPFSAFVDEVDRHGRALPNLGSLPHITLGGATATGTHGSGSSNPCLAAGVREIEMVRADGELVTLRRGEPDFDGAVVALGALGVVVRMRLATVPAFELCQDVWLDAPLHDVLDDFDEIMDSAHSVSLFTAPGRPDVVDQLWFKQRADVAPVDAGRWGARPASAAVHPVAGADVDAVSPQLGQPRASFEVLPHFRADLRPSTGDEQQSEFLVPRAHGAAAFAAVVRLGLGPVVQVMEIRTIAADDLWLSPAYQRDSVGVHVTWRNDDAAVRAALDRMQRALAPYEPRPHWGKVFTVSPDSVRSQYERLPDFRGLVGDFDPQHTFGNDFLDRYVY